MIKDTYRIPSEFTLWKKGGYGNIYRNNNTIIKQLPKYENKEQMTIDNTSVIETMISIQLPNSIGFAKYYDINCDEDSIFITQSYEGNNLYQWKKRANYNEVIKELPNIIYQLLKIIIFLENIGIYYTDIKLCNIIWNDNKITLIDYNCVSLQYQQNNKIYNIDAVGTWRYSPPEIIMNSKVYSNSSTWSVAMIIAELLDDYPIRNEYFSYIDDNNKNTHEYWIRIMEDIFYDNPDNVFGKCYKYLPVPWKEWIIRMTQWDPKMRMSKEDLLHDLDKTYCLHDFPEIDICNNLFAKPINLETRSKYIQQLYDYAKETDQLFKLCSTIYIWDVYNINTKHLCTSDEYYSLYACWMIAGIILNEDIYLVDEFPIIFNIKPDNHINIINECIWNIFISCNWNLYHKSCDLYIIKHCNNIPWDTFIEFYKKYDKPYNPFTLYQDFVKTLPPI